MEERAEDVHAGIRRAAPRAGMDGLRRSTQRPGQDTNRRRPARIHRVVNLKECAGRAAIPGMSSDSDEAASRNSAGVDTHEFFLPGAGVSALLIHGLTGTPYEMRYLGERLAARGVRVRGVKLAGHAGTPEELGETGYDNWYESVVNGLEELRQYGEPNVVVGLSMGAVLAVARRGVGWVGAAVGAYKWWGVALLLRLGAHFPLPIEFMISLRRLGG